MEHLCSGLCNAFTDPCLSVHSYNLGYLPKGDKSITTTRSSTLKSIESALQIVRVGGLISILCYVGHPEGEQETMSVQQFVSALGNFPVSLKSLRPKLLSKMCSIFAMFHVAQTNISGACLSIVRSTGQFPRYSSHCTGSRDVQENLSITAPLQSTHQRSGPVMHQVNQG